MLRPAGGVAVAARPRQSLPPGQSNLSLGKDMLIALDLLAGIGLVLSIGSAAVELMALT